MINSHCRPLYTVCLIRVISFPVLLLVGLQAGKKKKTFVGSFLSVQQQHQQINRVMSWVLDIRLIWW